jgi:hypothetical protein
MTYTTPDLRTLMPDIPSDKACGDVNPDLWEAFCRLYLWTGGMLSEAETVHRMIGDEHEHDR